MPLLQLLSALLSTARSSLKSHHVLALENLALRQQLAILRRRTKRPQLTKTDRAFWVALDGEGYATTRRAQELCGLLGPLDSWSKRWARQL